MKKITSTLIVISLLIYPPLFVEAGEDVINITRTFREQISSEIGTKEKTLISANRMTYDVKKNLVTAEGDVKITYSDISVQTDYAELDRITSRVEARGNVVFKQQESYINSLRIEMDLETKRGTIYEGQGFIAPTYYFSGEVIELLDNNTLRIVNGVYTACDQCLPDWKIKVGEGTIRQEDYAYLKKASFWVKNLPLFYSPYLILPTNTQRATGFLIPEAGYSDSKGTYIGNKFYWNMAEWMDSTFLLDYYNKTGLGGGLNYKYALTGEDRGEIETYYIEDKNTKDARWNITGDLRNNFSDKLLGVASVDIVSDKNFNQDYENDISIRTLRDINSYVYLQRSWDKFNLRLLGNYEESLDQDMNYTFKIIPGLGFNTIWQDNPFVPGDWGLESSFVNFERKIDSSLEQTQRFDFHPQFLYTVGTEALSLTPRVGFRETFYTNNKKGDDESREIYETGLTFKGPNVYRFFATKWGNISHQIEPRVDYTYIPNVNQADIFYFDGIDRIERKNKITYSLSNRFYDNNNQESGYTFTRQLALLRISQDYDIHESRRDDDQNTRERRPLSNILGEFQLTPRSWCLFNIESEYNVYDDNFDSVGVDNRFNYKKYLLNLGWRYKRFLDRTGQTKTNFLHGEIGLPVYKKWRALYSTWFNVEMSRFLENRYLLDYNSQCWGITFEVIDRPVNDEYSFLFRLKTIGEFGI
ncbi:MAG: LPS assembly protein LptD [bacterium]